MYLSSAPCLIFANLFYVLFVQSQLRSQEGSENHFEAGAVEHCHVMPLTKLNVMLNRPHERNKTCTMTLWHVSHNVFLRAWLTLQIYTTIFSTKDLQIFLSNLAESCSDTSIAACNMLTTAHQSGPAVARHQRKNDHSHSSCKRALPKTACTQACTK